MVLGSPVTRNGELSRPTSIDQAFVAMNVNRVEIALAQHTRSIRQEQGHSMGESNHTMWRHALGRLRSRSGVPGILELL